MLHVYFTVHEHAKKKKKKKKRGTLLRGSDLGPRHKDIGEIEKLL